MSYINMDDVDRLELFARSAKLLDFCLKNNWSEIEIYSTTTNLLAAMMAIMDMDEEDMRMWYTQISTMIKENRKELECDT